MIFWQTIVLPIGAVLVSIVVIALLASRKPRWSLFLILAVPPIILIVFIYLYSQPSIATALGLDSQVLPQVMAASIGAVIGILGAAVIAYIEKQWGEGASKSELDWRLLVSLNEKLTELNFPNHSNVQKVILDGVLNQAINLATLAEEAQVINCPSQYGKYASECLSKL